MECSNCGCKKFNHNLLVGIGIRSTCFVCGRMIKRNSECRDLVKVEEEYKVPDKQTIMEMILSAYKMGYNSSHVTK